MKTIASALLMMSLSHLSAQTFSTSFTDGLSSFTALNNTTVNTTTDGELTFVNTNNQGAGVTLDLDQEGVLGSDFDNLRFDAEGNPESLFFQIDTFTPMSTGAQDELGFFFGPSSGQAQSSDIFNGQNVNGFTFFFNDGGIFAQNGNGSQSSENQGAVALLPLNTLTAGDPVRIDIEWFLTPAQNGGQFNSGFNITVTTDTETASGTFDGAQNQGADQINNFQLTASTTQGLTGSIDSVVVSTEPISAIPEPSGVLLTGLGAITLLLRRKRA